MIERKLNTVSKTHEIFPQKSFKELLLLLKNTMDEVWIEEMLSAGKYPESEEEMLQLNADNSMSKVSYELISKIIEKFDKILC